MTPPTQPSGQPRFPRGANGAGPALVRVGLGAAALVLLAIGGNWIVNTVLNVGDFEVGRCYDGAKVLGANRADEVPCSTRDFSAMRALDIGSEAALRRSPFCRAATFVSINGDNSVCFGGTSDLAASDSQASSPTARPDPATSSPTTRPDPAATSSPTARVDPPASSPTAAPTPAVQSPAAPTVEPVAFGAWDDRLEHAWAARDEAALAEILSPEALASLRSFVTGDAIAIDLQTPCILGSSGSGGCGVFVRPDPDEPSGLPFYFSVREVNGEIFVEEARNEGD